MKNLFVSLVLATTLICPAAAQQQGAVTPVSGESWLSHLHRPLAETSMGMTGRLGPATIVLGRLVAEQNAVQRLGLELGKQSLTLQGADLYRLNCRACHGEFGLGAPPEINSVIGATRATSAALIMARMKERGLETSRAQANELANQAKGTLLERLHKGGVDMPPFPHLSEPEVRAIFAYLRQLAEIPGAERQQVHVQESSVRIGEHIVKSTCHVCHNAVGVNPSPDALMQGAIPPLSTLTTRVSLHEFERKVRHGAPIMMGTPLLPYRGRMPVFDYLNESEIADAYLYLRLYPPTAWPDKVNPPNQAQSASASLPSGSTHEPPNAPPHDGAAARDEAPEKVVTILPLVAEIMVALLIVGGVVFTVYDVRRTRPRAMQFLGRSGDRLAILSGQGGPVPAPSPAGSSGASNRRLQDANKQAAWHSRFRRTEYHLFETSWFSRRFENEDEAA